MPNPALAAVASAIVSIVAVACPATAAIAGEGPMKVFVLAGQSNMEGQAVADLAGRDYNEGKGTLAALLADGSTRATYAHLVNPDGSWRTRDDVWVRYQPERRALRTGALGFGFTPYGGGHHFGPELQFGHVMGDALEEEVLLVKTAWGGKSLFVDFRPPSAGGETGRYYTMMIEQVREALARAAAEFPEAKSRGVELAGFVWYHGWNDGCDPKNAVPAYEENLVHLIHDVRRDLGAPNLPVVVGEITGPWVEAPGEWGALRRAQAAAAAREEFKGSVVFVPTAAFVRDPEQSPNPGHGHHEFGNAETYFLVGDALGRAMRSLVVPGSPAFTPTVPAEKNGELSGYMLVPTERVPEEFNAGFSLYAAAWPLVDRYPGSNFQTGLFGTWMFAQFARGADGRHDPADKPKDMYSDIEGGLGWWRDTRFATAVPKFIMGGVAPDFRAWANGPGAGKGRDWSRPLGKYAVAQLSPRVVWPPDGLNLAQGTCGELFGYGYLPLPLAEARAAVDTGGQCWTLFVNTANFKGPVAFFMPGFWSEAIAERPELVGKLLDTRPSDPNKAFQMETQWIPAAIGRTAADGTRFARVAPSSFPVDGQGRTVVLHRLTCYTRAALPDAVRAWFDGGPAPSGAFDPAASHVQRFKSGGGSTWRIFTAGAKKEERDEVDWRSFGTPVAHDAETFGYQWNPEVVRRVEDAMGARMRMPEHFRLDRSDAGSARWKAVKASEVPGETGLASLRFDTPRERGEGAYETPQEADSPFRSPGPAAGPFETTLGDGSTVTYCWYRFCDQPAVVAAGLGEAEREEMQRRVELIHRNWTSDRDYIAPPTTGALAELDPALLVTPPAGLEVGFVPIAIRQDRVRK